jgi:hypothetical protein
MRFLDKFRRHPEGNAATQAPQEEVSCLHTALVPKWGMPSDMGDEGKASAWVCSVCGGTFTPDEARELRASESERVKQVLRPN